jgi:tRNA 2-thiouridine synthesizing protein A
MDQPLMIRSISIMTTTTYELPQVDSEIDARGSFCPGPLLEMIRGIKSVAVGSVVEVLSSDTGSNKDIPLWIAKAGHEFIGAFQEPGYTRFIVRKLR